MLKRLRDGVGADRGGARDSNGRRGEGGGSGALGWVVNFVAEQLQAGGHVT